MKLEQVNITQKNINDVLNMIKKNCISCNEEKLYDFGGNDVIESVVAVFAHLTGLKVKIKTVECRFESITFTDTNGNVIEKIIID